MRQVMPPTTPDETSSDTYDCQKVDKACKVKASITELKNSDDEIIKMLAPEIEKFGMIRMTIKVATNHQGTHFRWVAIEFDDIHDYNDFKHYIINQKGTISIFGTVLEFNFGSSKKKLDSIDINSNRKRRYNEYTKNEGFPDSNGNQTTNISDDHIKSAYTNDTDGRDLNEVYVSNNTTKKEHELHQKQYENSSMGEESDFLKVDTMSDKNKTANRDALFAGARDSKVRCFQRYDDKTPTRTLYFGNLERNIDALRVKRIFSKYGKILDIVVKRQGRYAAYGFVKFLHLKDALEAKNRLTGSYVGRHRMAVGYGSICQTCLVWIGDYTRQINVEEICKEVKKYATYLDYSLGKDSSYIYFVFNDIQDSLKVIKNLRGLRLNNYRYPVQVDFADPLFEARGLYEQYHKSENFIRDGSPEVHRSNRSISPDEPRRRSVHDTQDKIHSERRHVDPISTFSSPLSEKSLDESKSRVSSYQDRKIAMTGGVMSSSNQEKSYGRVISDTKRDYSRSTHSHSLSKDRVDKVHSKNTKASYASGSDKKIASNSTTITSTTSSKLFNDASVLIKTNSSNVSNESNQVVSTSLFSMVWKGCLSVKSQYYPTKLHYISGNSGFLSSLPNDLPVTTANGSPLLPTILFQKRYPLTKDHLEEFKTNLASAILCNDYCAFLGLPYIMSSSNTLNNNLSANNGKPLKELISYLIDRNTAVHINDFNSSNQLSLYVFPPCDFSREFLSTTLPPDNKMVLSLAATSHVLVFITK